jgi:3-oxoacyl-[acyl-carrier-protein] synthase II
VITGAGVVSPIGIGHNAYWESLVQQRSGVKVLPTREDIDLPVRIGAAIQGFDPKAYVKPRKALKVMCREIQTGFSSAGLAFEQARLDRDQLDPERLGVVFGSEMLYCEPQDMQEVISRCMEDGRFHFERWGEASMATMYPLWMLMYLPNMISCHIGIAHDARGPNNTICQGDVSSLLAIIEAASILHRGQADVMIAGGSSSRLSMTQTLYRDMAELSRRVDCPAEACRPFDATRDGTVNGEGAAAFVLESESHALRRNAPILARLSGWGMSVERGEHREGASVEAIRRCVRQALESAALTPDEVGHVNAHASGLPRNDTVEAQAIAHHLGDVPVTAPKSYFGTLGASGGAVEMVASILALEKGLVPVTLNYHQPDPDCPVRVVHGQPASATHSTAIVLSQSMLGQAVALVLDARRLPE